jgi:hypothetical protein
MPFLLNDRLCYNKDTSIAKMIHIDPDFRSLSLRQREAVLSALYAMAACGSSQRASGVMQQELIHAIGSSLLAVEGRAESFVGLQEELAPLFSDVPESTRHRVFHLFVLAEVIADPLPQETTQALKDVAEVLQINDEFMEVVRDYSQGAYAIAASDLHRKGYLGNPEIVRKGSEAMRVNKILTDPFEVDEDDPDLLKQWQELEICPEGSLGRDIWKYYIGRGFVFTGQKGSVNPTIAQHDWIHVLADYATTIEGELEVFSFIGSAIPDPQGFSFLVSIIGLFETARLESWAGGVLIADRGHLEIPGMPERVADAIRRGRLCNRDVMYGIDYFEYKDLPIAHVRDLLGFAPKASDISSPGIWHPDGITSYQRENGDPRYQPPLPS